MINQAILTPLFTEKYGGPYEAILELVSHLEKLGVNSKIFTTSFIAQKGKERTVFLEKKSKNITIHRFHSFLKFRDYRISFRMFPFLLKEAKNIDIINSNALRSYQEDIGSIVSILKKKPFIITPHGAISINWSYNDKIPKMIHDKTIGYFKRKLLNPHFIAVAKNEIPIIKKYGIDDTHIHYIPHGVNTDIFKPVNSDDLKKKWNLENSNIILYVGRIAKGKGVDILIKILNLIVKKNKNVKLIIIGPDAGFLQIVRSLIHKYNLSKYVIFPGFIPKKNLAKYYSMSDLVVYPSSQEIFGMVITEAMACEKAVISSDIMGPKEIILDGKTGYLSNFKNLNEVSQMILDLLNDKKQLITMGKNGLERVKNKYSWQKAAKNYFTLYKKILNL
ncbi:MAG: glycosyltransferase family 4 protein [Promethearchaeota archaeon]